MAVLPVFNNDQIADYLTNGFWGGSSNPLNLTSGNTIYVDFNGFAGTNAWGDADANGISAIDRGIAILALQAWADATGLNFVEGNGSTTIYFYDAYNGAYGGNFGSTGAVNINPTFSGTHTGAVDTYIFQIYMHEIGHVLGLGHGGDYSGSADYRTQDTEAGDNHYLNDSWQATVMSYFSQSENTWLTATTAYTLTPMVADVIAIRNLYGTTGTTRTGDTTYGHNSNAGGVLQDWENYGNNTVMVVVDDGGIDTFDFSNYTVDQRIDLREEAFSNVLGEVGTVGISRDTVIENAIGGSARDTIFGNDAGNILRGMNGDDTLRGEGGNDLIRGGDGEDSIYGGDNNDILRGGRDADYIEGNAGIDTIWGGGAADEIYGGLGNDTIRGGSGADRIYGDGGNDILYGNGGRDYLNGGGNNDTMYGGNGNDRLVGGSGHDTMFGEDDDDILDGQAGHDIYWGGNGADTFIFNGNDNGNDRIEDYTAAENDVITFRDVSGVDSFVISGNDIVITVGSQVVTVVDGFLEGLVEADLVFV